MSEQRKPYVRPASTQIEGRLVRSAEIKTIQKESGGKTLMKFSIASDGPVKVNSEGSQTSYFECESWNEAQINLFTNSLKKGVEVQVTGRPYNHQYKAEAGHTVTVPRILVESIKLLASPVKQATAEA